MFICLYTTNILGTYIVMYIIQNVFRVLKCRQIRSTVRHFKRSAVIALIAVKVFNCLHVINLEFTTIVFSPFASKKTFFYFIISNKEGDSKNFKFAATRFKII